MRFVQFPSTRFTSRKSKTETLMFTGYLPFCKVGISHESRGVCQHIFNFSRERSIKPIDSKDSRISQLISEIYCKSNWTNIGENKENPDLHVYDLVSLTPKVKSVN